MKAYFLRHAESEYNVKGMINNDVKNKDVNPLSALGVKQAEKAAKKLKNVKFGAIYASEFLRTRQTAEIVNKYHGLIVKIDKRLNEVNVGFEGMPSAEFDLARRSSGDEFNFKIKGKESWNDLKKRVGSFLDELKKKRYQNVLVVSHQWTLGVANQLLKNLSNEEAFRELLGKAEFFSAEI